ncbi:MAG TPA: hypothetical protein VKA65_03060 [Acidimicrobiales bacterium]|nr:hypothetical protein [Acidimicrobiales bacterium]
MEGLGSRVQTWVAAVLIVGEVGKLVRAAVARQALPAGPEVPRG